MKFNFTELCLTKTYFFKKSTFRVLGYMLFFFKLLGAKLDSHFGRQAVSYKAKHTINNHASRYLLKAENLCPHKNLHFNIYRGFIHNCQKLEVANISLNRWMDKQNSGTFHTMNYYSAIKEAIKPRKDTEET